MFTLQCGCFVSLCRNIVDLYPFLLTASKSVADSDVAELKNLRKGLFANVISQGTKTDVRNGCNVEC
jgi:hypothetical protein